MLISFLLKAISSVGRTLRRRAKPPPAQPPDLFHISLLLARHWHRGKRKDRSLLSQKGNGAFCYLCFPASSVELTKHKCWEQSVLLPPLPLCPRYKVNSPSFLAEAEKESSYHNTLQLLEHDRSPPARDLQISNPAFSLRKYSSCSVKASEQNLSV